MKPEIYIPIITALVGIVIGGLTRELGVMFHGYREDKRVLKRVLYNQLDMWFEIKRADIGRLIPIYLQKLGEKFRLLGVPAESVNQLSQIDYSQLVPIIRSLKLGEPERLFDRYQNSINDLAEVDPILAYTISGRPEYENLENKFKTFVEKVEQVASEETPSREARKLIEYLTSQYQERLFQQTLDAMELDILRVSIKIHLWTRFRAVRAIKRLGLRRETQMDVEVDKFIETLVAFVKTSEIIESNASSSKVTEGDLNPNPKS